MSGLFTKFSHVMSDGDILSGKSPVDQSLHMINGLAWVTVEGMQDDRWLSAGETVTIPRRRLVVVEADRGPGRVDIQPVKRSRSALYPREWLAVLARANTGA
jgi:hypothetical protein